MHLGNLISRIRGESQTIGVDIGHRLIKVAVIAHKNGGSAVLTALEQEPLKDGIVVDNEIKNAAGLIDAMQAIFKRALPGGVSGDVVFSVNWTNGILCDRISVKPLHKVPENELITQEAKRRSPFDDDGNVLDYVVMSRKDEGIDAMIVAAKSSVLNNWLNIFNALGIEPIAIDVDAFALKNAYTVSKGDEGSEHESLLIFNIGFSKSHLTYINSGKFNTARSIMGCSLFEIQGQLSERLNLSPEQSQRVLLNHSALPESADEGKLKNFLDFSFEEIHMKIDMAIRYLMSSSDSYNSPSKMLLSGGGAGIQGLATFLSSKLDLEVSVLQPFNGVEKSSSRFGSFNFNKAGGIYASAVGLALRRF